MRQNMIMVFAIVLSLFVLNEWSFAQESEQAAQPVPIKNSMMQTGSKMMGSETAPQGKIAPRGMMQGGMMGHMSGTGMMGVQDPLFKILYSYGCPQFLLNSAEPLGFSQKQIQRLETLKLEFKKAAVENKADRQIATIELKALLNSDPPNFKKAKAKINEISALEQQLRLTFFNTVIQGRKVLTPEQLKKLKGLAAQCPTGTGAHGTTK
ncbi:hypothetical protein BMS3Abin05_01100 [bacterium BMS3Abin05]|nr:hypothetical protein BMS3Abin05_01100 [bacterium BMS3Abin05]GBE28139.1 hypothetical protein BMS3Bbin03_02075 [bacterium BMS3Bbin03]HDL78794.1 periplasmic heavy metal sensor [Bacteroidota bacterium]